MEKPLTHQDRVLTPVSTSQRSGSSGGYRRRRDELDLNSEIDSPGGSVFSDASCSTATYGVSGGVGGGGGGSWGGSSWDGSDHEGGGPGSSDYDAMHQRERHAMGVPSSSGCLVGGGAYGSGSGNSKRAKLTSRSLSRLSEPDHHHGSGIMGGGAGMVGGGVGGARSPAGLLMTGEMLMRSGAGFDNSQGRSGGRPGHFVQSMSHTTEEWRAMSKAGRVLGVDSLEERDVEDQRRASSVKAARILGVENVADVAELQQNATAARRRQNWAPPRSNTSRRPGRTADSAGETAEGQREGRRRGAKPTKRPQRLSRSVSLSSRGPKGSGSKVKQGSISSLIRALEINGGSEAGKSQNGSSDNGDGSSVGGDNGSEDLPRKKGGGGKQETASNRSTRATESCSSVSDLAHTDRDGMSSHAGSALGDSCSSPASSFVVVQQQRALQQHGQQKKREHTRCGSGHLSIFQ